MGSVQSTQSEVSQPSSSNEESMNNTITETVQTWNGAISYASVESPLVELFFKSVRDTPCTDYCGVEAKKPKKDKKSLKTWDGGIWINKNLVVEETSTSKTLEDYFDKAWEVDPLRTLKFVFYLRDCRGGKGEKKLFRALIRHMRSRGLGSHVLHNMKHIPTFGTWKDPAACFFGTELEGYAVRMYADQLRKDQSEEHPSLCVKFVPKEGRAYDRKFKATSKIASVLGVNKGDFRRQYIFPIGTKVNYLERQLCSGDWANIQYERVPSIAGSRYKKAFAKHDSERYQQYLESVQKGEKKMNTGVLMPYQMVAPLLNNNVRDETIEAQWTAFVADRRSKWLSGINVLPLVDVSGSMFTHKTPQPIEVAVALGLLFSELNTSPRYHRKFITFETDPQMVHIKGESLQEQVQFLKSASWGGSTDIQKAFNLILNTATMFNVPQEEMPQILLILSDMQFNHAHGDNLKTNWEMIDQNYRDAGYERPSIIFWNLNGTSVDYPVPNDKVPNCILMSGYNDIILYSLLDGKLPSPLEAVHKSLDAERYNVIKLA